MGGFTAKTYAAGRATLTSNLQLSAALGCYHAPGTTGCTGDQPSQPPVSHDFEPFHVEVSSGKDWHDHQERFAIK